MPIQCIPQNLYHMFQELLRLLRDYDRNICRESNSTCLLKLGYNDIYMR